MSVIFACGQWGVCYFCVLSGVSECVVKERVCVLFLRVERSECVSDER